MDDAKKAVLLFIENDVERAKELAAMLQSDNTDRRETDSSITKEALEIISNDPNYAHTKSTVLYQPHWHKGVVGIVASRVIESHYKPTIVLTLSEGLVTGSARSVRGFNVYEAIYACKNHLVTFGGHFAAAEEPANPVPTTIISNFLLLAGLTSLTEPLYFVHFSSNGPDGIFESSILVDL
jgi:single-stranded-DNA-specific exonuclease